MSIPNLPVDTNSFFIYAVTMNQVKIGRSLFTVLSRTDTHYTLSRGDRLAKSPRWIVDGILCHQGQDMGIKRLSGDELGEVEFYISDLVSQFQTAYKCPVVIKFTANSGSCCIRGGLQGSVVKIGTRGEGVAIAYRLRFMEYASVAPYVIGNRVINGMEAIHYLTLHELAHCLQTPNAVPHGRVFVKLYKQLLAQFPFCY